MVKLRDTRPSNKMELGRVLSTIDWSCLDLINSCEGKLAFFNKIILDSLNFIMPVKIRIVHNNDAPWMSDKLKRLIKKRQRALQSGNRSEFKYYRNVVNMERKKCKAAYYDNKIKNLKHVKPRNWWSAVKKISGMDTIIGSDLLSNLHVDDLNNLSDLQVGNKINDKFLEPLQAFQPLQVMVLSNHAASNVLAVSELEVWKYLSSLNPWKSGGPDDLPSWVLKEYSIILSLPVMKILNSSYVENKLPPIWKQANVIPVPKVIPVQDINLHLRPISLTPILSKVAEEFVVSKHLKPAILKVIDVNQYGVIPGSSTSQALIKMLHKWSEATDGARASVRILLVDYKKAFDYVDHTIVLSKLKTLDIPNSTISWIADFLTDRKQRIKLGYDCFSEWGNVPAGVPQGTKLGPWLFILMINDLKTCSSDEIKFVDDLTVSETVAKSSSSNMQHVVSEIEEWSESNLFKLNENKCKEMQVDFARNRNRYPPIEINGKPLEVVEEAKLLGLTIASNLRWNSHVNDVVSKSSKRVYLLVQLKRAKVPIQDILQFYSVCVRPILEYASTVFHYSIPKYLSDEIERVQKRALRIVYPNLHYEDALVEAGMESLYARRQKACDKLFKQILEDPNHKLNNLIPRTDASTNYQLRNDKKIHVPKFCTERFKNTYIIASCLNLNNQ